MEKFSTSSDNVKRNLIEEVQKSDPTKSSPIPSKLNLEYINNDIKKNFRNLKDIETGEVYIEKKGVDLEESKVEHFVSLLSKGILNISDFIEKDGKHYSHKMPIENIESSSNEALQAELFMLLYLFGDWDHKEISAEGAIKDAEKNGYISGISSHQNYIKNESNQFVHYDYGRALQDASWISDLPFNPGDKNNLSFKFKTIKFLRDKFNQGFNFKKFKFEPKNPENLETDTKKFNSELSKRTTQFYDALNDKKFFKAVLDKSKIDLSSDRFFYIKGNNQEEKSEEFRKYLLGRISILKSSSKFF